MKIAVVNTSWRTGGAAIVTTRLTRAMRELGHDARLITFDAEPGAPDWVIPAAGRYSRWTRFLPERALIYGCNGFNRANLFKVSTATHGLPLHRHPWIREADAVILNWINQGTLSIGGVERICSLGKPVAWVMHDLWPMTGVCHYPHECTGYRDRCGRCQFLAGGMSANDLSRYIWKRKQRLYASSPLRFVAVSDWVRRKAAESSLLRDMPVTVIPHAFPVDRYTIAPDRPIDLPGVDTSRHLILFGAARLDVPIKGLEYAVDALNRLFMEHPGLANSSQAVFFGAIRQPEKLDAILMNHVHAGPISDPDLLARLYSSASVVLSTALYETVGATLIEGQAAGCVPVAFGSGGQADVIRHLDTGYLARFKDTADVTRGLVWALTTPPARQYLHDTVAATYSADIIARRYIDLLSAPRS